MNKVKVSFREQAKGVIAETHIESDELTAEEVLKQNKELFEQAQKYSKLKTLEKLR